MHGAGGGQSPIAPERSVRNQPRPSVDPGHRSRLIEDPAGVAEQAFGRKRSGSAISPRAYSSDTTDRIRAVSSASCGLRPGRERGADGRDHACEHSGPPCLDALAEDLRAPPAVASRPGARSSGAFARPEGRRRGSRASTQPPEPLVSVGSWSPTPGRGLGPSPAQRRLRAACRSIREVLIHE